MAVIYSKTPSKPKNSRIGLVKKFFSLFQKFTTFKYYRVLKFGNTVIRSDTQAVQDINPLKYLDQDHH